MNDVTISHIALEWNVLLTPSIHHIIRCRNTLNNGSISRRDLCWTSWITHHHFWSRSRTKIFTEYFASNWLGLAVPSARSQDVNVILSWVSPVSRTPFGKMTPDAAGPLCAYPPQEKCHDPYSIGDNHQRLESSGERTRLHGFHSHSDFTLPTPGDTTSRLKVVFVTTLTRCFPAARLFTRRDDQKAILWSSSSLSSISFAPRTRTSRTS